MSEVSIIIPVYNAEKTLQKCLSSVQAQTFTNFEVIMVNDGSTDNSLKICEKFCLTDRRFKLINQENGGPSKARNAAINFSKSKYLAFVDADDYIEPDLVEIFYNNAEKTNADLTICSYIHDLTNGTQRKMTCRVPSGVYTDQACKNIAEQSIEIWPSLVLPYSWVRFVKRNCLKNSKLQFNPKVVRSEDYLLWTQMFFHINRLCVLSDKYLYHYVENKNSLTHNYIAGYWNMTKQLYNELRNSLPQEKNILEHIDTMLIQRSWVALNISAKAPTREKFLDDFYEVLQDNALKKAIKAIPIKRFDKRHWKFHIFLKLRLHLLLRVIYTRKHSKFLKSPGLLIY